tara:strand:- start:1624 stop:2826 length:1203 start_codon:yes stop_codon:yes gene_type:complete
MATYTNNLKLKEITSGSESGSWGDSTNTNLDLIAESFGYASYDAFSSDADATKTVQNSGATQEFTRGMYVKITSSATLSATRTLTIAPNDISRVLFILNSTTGSQDIIIKQGSGATITIANGATKCVYLDGAGSGAAVVEVFNSFEFASSKITGTTPTLTIGDGDQEDAKIVFDGNAQDFHVGLDDSADDLVIGKGSALGTTTAIGIDENLLATFHGGITMVGTTPTLTIGDAGAEDTKIVFDGNAQDFYMGLDDSADTLILGTGSTVGSGGRLNISSSQVELTDGSNLVLIKDSDGNGVKVKSDDAIQLVVERTSNSPAVIAFTTDEITKTAKIEASLTGMKFYTNSASRMLIKHAGDIETDQDLKFTDDAKGPIIKSPNGTYYRLIVSNLGALNTESV